MRHTLGLPSVWLHPPGYCWLTLTVEQRQRRMKWQSIVETPICSGVSAPIGMRRHPLAVGARIGSPRSGHDGRWYCPGKSMRWQVWHRYPPKLPVADPVGERVQGWVLIGAKEAPQRRHRSRVGFHCLSSSQHSGGGDHHGPRGGMAAGEAKHSIVVLADRLLLMGQRQWPGKFHVRHHRILGM